MGGFVFYASFVVPIVKEVSGETGFITRHVAIRINAVGALALGWWLFQWIVEWKIRSRRWLTLGLILSNAGLLASLCALHPLIEVDDYPTFYFRHRIYLWISTFQLVLAIVLLWVELIRWRKGDREIEAARETKEQNRG
jgi:hypothetical protein